MKKIFFVIFLTSFLNVAYGSDSVSFHLENACLNSDGVPMVGELISRCCTGSGDTLQMSSNPPEECLSGVGSTSGDSQEGFAATMSLALHTLRVAEQLDGQSSDFTAPETLTSASADNTQPQLSAMAAGANGGIPSSSLGDLLSGLNPFGGSGKGGSANMGGAGGGGLGFSGLGSDSSSGHKKTKTGTDDTKDSSNGSGYVRGEGGKGKGDGSEFKVGMDGFGADQKYGGSGSDTANGGAGDGLGDDGDGKGSPNDPANYFSMIDKSANIFKVVTNRYMKKKTLFQAQAAVKQ